MLNISLQTDINCIYTYFKKYSNHEYSTFLLRFNYNNFRFHIFNFCEKIILMNTLIYGEDKCHT